MGNLFVKRAKVVFHYIFYLVLLNLIIIVYQYMTHFFNHVPWSIWVSFLEKWCQFIGCFTYNLDTLDDAVILKGVSDKSSIDFSAIKFNTRSIASFMCSRRPLSLTGSLIYQNFITVSTFHSKRQQGAIGDQINGTTQLVFQIDYHSCVLHQTDTCILIEFYQQVHIAFRPLLTTGERTKQPYLQDGLRLEVLGYHLCHVLGFGAHSVTSSILICKYRDFFFTRQTFQKIFSE